MFLVGLALNITLNGKTQGPKTPTLVHRAVVAVGYNGQIGMTLGVGLE